MEVKAAGKILKFYSGLIAGCLPLFVATGLLTALCSSVGELGMTRLQEVPSLLNYLVIPVLMGYQAGKKCGGDSGGLAGALAASAVVMTGTAAAFLASVLAGSCAGFLYHKGMNRLKDRIPPGFEMLAGNLYLVSTGLLSGLLAYCVLLPGAVWSEQLMSKGITLMMRAGLLPLVSFLVEPLKILFFNNWLNHGFLLPLGMEQAGPTGNSILFLLESNPGPGFGILAAYALICRNQRKETASSLIIEMFGGIHEVYFPYVLSDLKLLLAAMAGGIAGNYCFLSFGSGLSGPPSPGSVLTILMMADAKQWPGLLMGIGASAAVSCLLSCLILSRAGRYKRADKNVHKEEEDRQWEVEKGLEMKREGLGQEEDEKLTVQKRKEGAAIKIYFVCDAGMGSSAMASAMFKRKLKNMDFSGEVEVFHVPADGLPEEADVIVCQKDFGVRLPQSGARRFEVESLVDMTCYHELFQWLKGGG